MHAALNDRETCRFSTTGLPGYRGRPRQYDREAGEKVASGFIEEIEDIFRSIAETPGAGSPLYAFELEIPGLRARTLKRYPYLVFYLERDDRIDAWRILHTQRDVPRWMADAV